MPFSRTLLFTALTITALSGCDKKDADEVSPDTSALVQAPQMPEVPRVASMQLGRAVDSMNNISGGVTTQFGTGETFYLSVRSEHTAPGSMVSARWMNAAGKTIDSTAQQVAAGAAAASATTQFHLSKATPWPAGKYQVEVFLDGASQGIKEFEVMP